MLPNYFDPVSLLFLRTAATWNSVWFARSNGTTEIRETIATTEGLTWIKEDLSFLEKLKELVYWTTC